MMELQENEEGVIVLLEKSTLKKSILKALKESFFPTVVYALALNIGTIEPLSNTLYILLILIFLVNNMASYFAGRNDELKEVLKNINFFEKKTLDGKVQLEEMDKEKEENNVRFYRRK